MADEHGGHAHNHAAGARFTDSAALAIALAAVRIGQRPAGDART